MQTTPRPAPLALRTLRLRLQAQQAELRTCTTAAQTRCVMDAVLNTQLQIAAVGS